MIPPFTDIRSVQTLIEGDKLSLVYGAQDLSPADSGAYTGDISGSMLAKLGCTYVVDRSLRAARDPRRDRRGRNAKVKAAYKHGLVPILCLGEGLEVREAGNQVEHSVAQLKAALDGISAGRRGEGRRRLRAGLGDRHRPGRDAGRRAGGLRGAARGAGRAVRAGGRRRRPDPVRRLGEVRQRRRDRRPSRTSTARWSAARASTRPSSPPWPPTRWASSADLTAMRRGSQIPPVD